MNIKEKLSRTLSADNPPHDAMDAGVKAFYERVAANYARMEGAIAVLSDMRECSSNIYYGRFAQTLGFDASRQKARLNSIWEEELFQRVHPDDLQNKYVQELKFYNFVLRQRAALRDRYHLESELRMRDRKGNLHTVRHRMFYILNPKTSRPWLALCLYQPAPTSLLSQSVIVDSTDGRQTEIDSNDTAQLLSSREREILQLISQGLTSKEIAARLCISPHTVNRHRQDILLRLNVKNSVEACRVARGLKLF